VPNTRSAAKMMRVAERRRQRNRAVKSAVKTFIRKAERGITATVEDATTLVRHAVQSLDKAASKGVLHRKNAARRKSRLMKKLNASLAPAAEPAAAATAKPTRRSSSRSTSKSGTRSSTRTRTARKS
jgi:small subunit ribosomal protein S20